MRILVATSGRFHMFELARQMRRLGETTALLTAYPRFKVYEDLRPISYCFPAWTFIGQAMMRVRWGSGGMWQKIGASRYASRKVGEWVRDHADEIDIMDALSGVGLQAGRLMRSAGKPWIVNRGSTHLLHQKEILEEEHRLCGVAPPNGFPADGLREALAEYEEADAVVVPTEHCRRTFLDRGHEPGRVFKCPYGVDLSTFRPLNKLPDKVFRICFVGTYSVRKGIHYLFEAIRPLVRGGGCECWLVGGPSEEAKPILQRNADLYIDKGFVPQRRLSEIYSSCHALVLPSVEEGLALVQAQAMACGTPVIATVNTGAADLFADGVEGFILPIRDALAIREKIQWMMDNPIRRHEMGLAAVARVRALGDWDTYGQGCLQMYSTVLARKNSSLTPPNGPIRTTVQTEAEVLET